MKDFTRRDFIKTTGLAAGGLMISSGLLKAQGKKAMRAADWARGAHLDGAYCK